MKKSAIKLFSFSVFLGFVAIPLQATPTVLVGDYEISEDVLNSEDGNLSVNGTMSIEGNVLDFGTTGTSVSAVMLEYGESGSVYTLRLGATRANSIFAWEDNAAGTARSKMNLSETNVLTIYDSMGAAKIVLDPNSGGAGITLNDQNLLTQTTASTLYLPLVPGSLKVGSSVTVSNGGSAAFGDNTSATSNLAVAFGSGSTASGSLATAFGNGTVAQSMASVAIGRYNVAQGTQDSWVATDDLFVVGNGVSTSNRSNAFVIKKNGDITVNGMINFTKGLQYGDGVATGVGSIASGNTNYNIPAQALGAYSLAFGSGSIANGHASLVLGQANTTGPNGLNSLAAGQYNSVMAYSSVAVGNGNYVAATCAAALGVSTQAYGMGQTVLGHYNVNSGNPSINSVDSLPSSAVIFLLGNGTSSQRSNAMTVQRSGQVRASGVVEAKAGFRTPPLGDLSMGDFTAGQNPADLNPALGLKYTGE